MSDVKRGFEPFFHCDSKLLILGSFPSVKSRQVEFYYGNKQNRFWRTVCSFFGDEVPETTDGKKEFLSKRKIALCDVVTECEIVGSQDATIKNFKVANVEKLLQNTKISFIIINGGTAFNIFEKNFSGIGVPYKKLPSTSPANTKFSKEEWFDTLSGIFGRA
ncbi:MAG: DNA-deoxyinosine glycosylase [Clostridia bacterium]|nr:DNA-deoxyinosine glycosylase [Clostridia bacterium]